MTEERRLVTILFADVVGSTTLGDALDPEDLRALLGRYYGIARDVISARGGTVEKFIGDAVMAVFGLPAAHDDDPSRALDAAIELRDAVRADAVLADRMPIRIGVNTGEVVAAVDPTARDFLITGDPVNVAARLQQAADPWGIVCSDRTARAASDAFEVSEPFAIEARGKPGAVAARHVLGRSAASRPARGPRTPLIGRDADLAQLELVSKRAFAERRPYLVSVIAPPGAGKSRLLEAFLDRLPDLAPGARPAVAQCLPYGQRLTFWPLRSLLEALAGVNFDSAPERIRESIASWLHGLGDEAAERTADQLAATLGATELEIVDRYEVFGAWRHAIEVAAGHGPIVLAVEDLHWSSESLLDMIEFIFQPRPDVPMLMLALSRPELLDRRPGWGGGRRNYVSLSLEPLGDDDIGQVVASLLEDPAPEVVAAVVDRADGNPFYAGEMVRSLVELRANLHEPEAVAEALAKLPDTVQATVLARLDLLSPAPRRVLQLGSVLGRSFDHISLGVLDPRLDDSLSEATDLLVDREMIIPGPAQSWTFRHILIREVAYQTLPRADRAHLHAAAGRYFEGLPGEPEERAELVAFHFREAANLSAAIGEATQELRRSAVEWLQRAGDAAFRGGATVEATRHLRAAIELVKQEDPEVYQRMGEVSVDVSTRGNLPDLYRRLGEVSWAGNLSVDAFRDAYTVGRELGRPPAFLLLMLAEQLMVLTRWHASVAQQSSEEDLSTIRDEGKRLLGIVEDERARASFLIAEGFVPFWIRSNGQRAPTAAEIAETEASARAGLALAEKLEDPRLISAALDVSSSFVSEDEPARAREIQRRRWQYADRLTILERTDAFQMVAWLSAVLGEADEALRATEAGLATIEGRQAPETVLTLLAWKAWALAMQGGWDQVSATISEQRQMWYDSSRPAAGYALQGPLAASYVANARGDEPLLDMCREQIDEICARFGSEHPVRDLAAIASLDLDAVADRIVGAFERYIERLHHVALGIAVTADRGHPLPADPLDRLIEHAGKRGMRWIEAEARRARALASGNLRELERARALLDGTGMAPRVARMEADLGLRTGDEGRFQDALRQLEALRDVDSGTRLAAARRERPAAGA
jgi:class 3 adenylate cyclase